LVRKGEFEGAVAMSTRLTVDDNLIKEACRLGRHKTGEQAIAEALQDYIKKRKRLAILEFVNSIEYYPDYDIVETRRRMKS